MEHRSLAPDLIIPDDDNACGNQQVGEPATNVAPEELRQKEQVGGPVNCSDSELSIYLQALEAGFLATYYSDTSPFAQSKLMSIASRSYQRDKKTVLFHGFQSLQMSRNSTEDRGEELLTSYLAGFHVRTSAPPEKAQGSPESGQDCGKSLPGSFARYDRDSSSWKTRQCSLLGGLTPFSGTWPRWGMMRNGECWERSTPVLHISGKGSGLWPTPQAHYCHNGNHARVGRYGTKHGGRNLNDEVAMWPTPTCGDGKSACNATASRKIGSRHHSGTTLTDAVKLFPTPAARDYRSPNKKPYSERGGGTKGEQLPNAIGGSLNPTWVEWLMNWPLGWTNIEPLPRESFEQWRVGNGSTQERTYTETLRELRGNNDSTSMGEWKTGQHIQGSEILRVKVLRGCEHGGESNHFNNPQEGSANNDSGRLQTMRINGECSEAPRGEKIKGCSLSDVPHGASCECGDVGSWWQSEPTGVPRVARGVKARVNRLTAIGNGQVPAVAALAWETLIRR